ncbi:MAG TPA: ParA family protein [Mycobacteriales bacterium]|nr:ParA family protein [Mycobacteriales bacterium]
MTGSTGLGWPERISPPPPTMGSGLGWPGPPKVPPGGMHDVSRETAPPTGAQPSDAAVSRETAFPLPAAQRVIAVANQKGGVGKTTSAVNMAAALALGGAQVLCIDLDPQGNASTALSVEHHEGTPSVYDALIGRRTLDEVISATSVAGLFCAPATIDLAGAEIELVPMVARETRLERAIASLTRRFDYVIVDCPPSLGLLTVNALVAAREILIPIQCEYYALEGLGQLMRNVELIRTHLNAELQISAILLTMYDARTRLAEQVVAEVREHFGERVLGAMVPRSVRIAEAPGFGQTVLTYDAESRGAQAYRNAARELAERGAEPGVPAASTTEGERR